MAIYNFKCESCEFMVEVIQPMASATFNDRVCPACGGMAKHQFGGAPAVATQNMSQSPLDVIIGKDAEQRWKVIHERKAERDKIRKETGTQALTATGRNDYQPIKGGRLEAVSVPENTVNKD